MKTRLRLTNACSQSKARPLMRGVMCNGRLRLITLTATLVSAILVGCNQEFPASSAQLKAAEDAYNPGTLAQSLRDIETWHIKHKTGLADSLRDGISMSSIEAAFPEEECNPNDELKMMWSWRNGEQSSAPFIWYHDFLSMEEAKSEYKWLLLNPLITWDPNYIPAFTFEGEWYAVYCGAESKSAGPIVHFFLEDGPRVTYTNITTFLSTMAEALNSGAVSWQNGAMIEDINKMHRIHQKYNNGLQFPYYVPKDT